MTPEAINQAMAELDGWEHHPIDDTRIYQWRREDREWFRSPPDCTEDLNAVARVVGKLDADALAYYHERLISIFHNQRNAIDATALQRCEAILRAVGKWVEG